MAFDLSAMLKDVPNSGTNREQIQYISRELIDQDPKNFYWLSNLDTLADNIATCGLQQPIRVRRHPDTPGRYMISSGHRRMAAIAILAQEEPDKWAEIPCILEPEGLSPEMQQLRLIYANANTREMTSAEIMEQREQVEKLLYQLKEQGHEFPGRMRDHVAEVMDKSKSKLARLKVIHDDLSEKWMPLFKDGKINESVAYELARLSSYRQYLFWVHWYEHPDRLYAGTVTNAARKLEKVVGAKCSHGFPKCNPGPDRVRKIITMSQYDGDCSGCCMDCWKLKDCKCNCSCSDLKKAELQAAAKEAKAKEKAANAARILPAVDYIRGLYARWSKLKADAGLSTEAYLKACGQAYLYDVKQFDIYEANPNKIIAENTKLPFATNVWYSEAQALCKAADVLGCTVDYLLGREAKQPEPEPQGQGPACIWHTGNPTKNGDYAVFVRDDVLGHFPTGMEWRDGAWYDLELVPFDDILAWTELPEVDNG